MEVARDLASVAASHTDEDILDTIRKAMGPTRALLSTVQPKLMALDRDCGDLIRATDDVMSCEILSTACVISVWSDTPTAFRRMSLMCLETAAALAMFARRAEDGGKLDPGRFALAAFGAAEKCAANPERLIEMLEGLYQGAPKEEVAE